MPEVSTAPSLSALYAKAVATGPLRRGDQLPDTEYVRRDIAIDRDHLAEYDRVCGFGLRDELPITYPHVLSFGLSVQLMTDPGFPFPLVGLVHVANSIRQERPLLVTDELTQRVRLADLRPHPKGRQFDVITETEVAGEVVWRETSTYLRRGGKSEDSTGQRATDLAGEPTATWRVPGDTGRRYAAVSGDRNPIHLNSLAAKAFGFPRAIAHGMWSEARCLAAFAERLPDQCTVDVEFRKPLLLPSAVDFAARREESDWTFALRSRSGKPHLLGSIR
ncbi:MaoC/PaaZ C-terminal domain-containing protein [Saccharopolyspora sp. WRP15-2]|uniref:MaoC/PaaZ C-terminal domain-containing protein n=1 Tax=Saccharopolyspora oryzae TaxID=2997343 RepID=A0ABT4V1I4_9PSEU|nr:MaoC/PaaZ C-terminal domain-containing protein [Saccharopolyspora oryzae]MDA3627800.1 MaoC/PaaZ C-terminal domain-containing protein [Saccharopolyspora oryzae]